MNTFDNSFSRLFMESSMIKNCLVFIIIFFFNSASLYSQSQTTIAEYVRHDSNNNIRLIVKEYAFCSCMFRAAKLDSVHLRDGSLSLYSELLTYSIDNRMKIKEFVHKYIDSLKSIVGEKHHDNPYPCNIASCLWLMNSEELEQLLDYLDRNEGVIPKNGDKKKRLRKSRK